MKLMTKRLVLRPITMKDKKKLIENINNIKVARYVTPIPYPYKNKDAEWFINKCKKNCKKKPRESYQFAIISKKENKLMGGVGLFDIKRDVGVGELGCWIAEKHWREGYGMEAIKRVIDFSFNKLKLKKVIMLAYIENKESNPLVIKLGGKLEGRLRQHVKAKATGKIHDVNYYGLLKEEWKK